MNMIPILGSPVSLVKRGVSFVPWLIQSLSITMINIVVVHFVKRDAHFSGFHISPFVTRLLILTRRHSLAGRSHSANCAAFSAEPNGPTRDL
jgi:hypothetical protein